MAKCENCEDRYVDNEGYYELETKIEETEKQLALATDSGLRAQLQNSIDEWDEELSYKDPQVPCSVCNGNGEIEDEEEE
jgi:hypothetical protein